MLGDTPRKTIALLQSLVSPLKTGHASQISGRIKASYKSAALSNTKEGNVKITSVN